MVTKTLVQLTDDLDPSLEAAGTVRFGLDGASYEIDLSRDHVDELRSALDRYIQHARKVGGRRGSAASTRDSSEKRTDLTQVREWAASNGVELSTRGRIARVVLAAYDAKDVAALRAATGQPEPPPSRPRRRGRARASATT